MRPTWTNRCITAPEVDKPIKIIYSDMSDTYSQIGCLEERFLVGSCSDTCLCAGHWTQGTWVWDGPRVAYILSHMRPARRSSRAHQQPIWAKPCGPSMATEEKIG